MSFADKKALWERSLVQAYNFADTDNTLDALSRMRRLKREVADARDAAADAEETTALSKFLVRVERGLSQVETRHEAWQESVRERAAQFDDAEREAYDAPLPVKGIH